MPIQIDNNTIIIFLVYKLAGLIVGLVFCYFGYKLFLKGITDTQGAMSADAGHLKFSLKSAAPGTFFAALGMFVTVFTLLKGFSFDSEVQSAVTAPRVDNLLDTSLGTKQVQVAPETLAARQKDTVKLKTLPAREKEAATSIKLPTKQKDTVNSATVHIAAPPPDNH